VFSARISQDLTKLTVIGKFSNSLRNCFCFVTSKNISRNELHNLVSKVLVFEKRGTNMAYGSRSQKATSDSARPSGNSPPESHILCGLLREASMALVTDCSVSIRASKSDIL
jgi:hypothetical protein